MPSQSQLRWAQLRVGLTVIFATIVLAVLIFLMSGTVGIFTPKLTVYAYFENASGLRQGAPVRLEGVDIGNVSHIRLVAADQQPSATLTTPPDQLKAATGPLPHVAIDKPVQVIMTVGERYHFNLRKDSIAVLSTAGVLGETFIDIDSTGTRGPVLQDKDILRTRSTKTIEGAVDAAQSTIENVNVLVGQLQDILGAVQNSQGSIGAFIYDKTLYNRLNATLGDMQKMVDDISNGRGSVGKLLASDEMYNKMNGMLDKLDKIVDDMNAGHGSAGKFLKDESLYNNLNQTVGKANTMLDKVNSNHGTVGKLLNDDEFAKKLDNIITRLSDISDRLDKGEGSMGKLLKDPSLFNNANDAIVETRNLIKAIRENPKKYLTIHFKVF